MIILFYFSVSLLITECIIYMDVLHHFPKSITNKCLTPKHKEIKMIDIQIYQTYNYIIYTVKWNKPERHKNEKFNGLGWDEFAKKINLCIRGCFVF